MSDFLVHALHERWARHEVIKLHCHGRHAVNMQVTFCPGLPSVPTPLFQAHVALSSKAMYRFPTESNVIVQLL